MNKINKDTLIPISLVITIVIVSLWVGQIHFTASANAKKLSEWVKIIQRVDTRLSRIEGRLQIEPLTKTEGEN